MNKDFLIQTHKRIKPYIHKTPVLTSQLLNAISEANIYFKCENFQKMGAFKMRGAVNAILNLSEAEKNKGVVAHSSGNFAQALALAAQRVGVEAYIVMPENAPQVKKDAVKAYGGVIIECNANVMAREREAERVQKEQGARFIHPSNDDHVIHGHATAAIELLEDHKDLDYIVVPVGGGGLLAGTILAVRYFSTSTRVIAGEPMQADDAYRSLISGDIEHNITTNTIADGLKTHLGDRNFPIIKSGVHQIIRVEEQAIIDAMKLIWERLKVIVEPSSAVAFAAVLKHKETLKHKKIGLILSGGNVDVSNLPF